MRKKTGIIRSIIVSKLKKHPYKLNFAVTSACNSRCKTCNVWRGYNSNSNLQKKDLSLREIEKIFISAPKSFVWLSLSGGEPFLRKDLVEICNIALQNLPSLSLISIPTNGLLQDTVIKKVQEILSLPLANLFINFSLDGPEKIHDKIRGISGAYKKTWSTYQNILALSGKEPRLAVNLETTISKYNLKYLESFFRKLTTEGHKITVTIAHKGYLYQNLEDNKSFTGLNHDSKTLNRVIDIIKKNLKISSVIDLVERIYLERISEFYRKPRIQPLTCIALESSIAIDAKGNITPCFMWNRILGNIRDFNLDLKRFSTKRKQEILKTRKLIKAGYCPNCWTPCEAYQSIINSLLTLKIFGSPNQLSL
ncbi:MAG TPA: radical SAM protein [Candidatus Bathyarchaeia archaeon]|nr:radical SAM protein [Candidatus Bathyarchaeia archaeon]